MPDQSSNWNNPVSATPDNPQAPDVRAAQPQAAPGVVANAPQAQPSAPAAPVQAPAQSQAGAMARTVSKGGENVSESAQPGSVNAPQPPSHPNTMAPDDRHSWALGKAYKSVLSGLGGGPNVSYVTDANGKQVAVRTPKTPGQQWKAIISAALVGLSAGAEAGQTAKAGGEALTGLGAGAAAEMREASQRDQLARKQSAEGFEREQQAVMQKANIAHLNLATLNNYFQMQKSAQDMNPLFRDNQQTVDDLQAANVGVKIMRASEAKPLLSPTQGNAQVGASDTLVSHFVLPLAPRPVMGPDGEPLLGADGKPQMESWVAVVDGNPDGKMPVTDAMRKNAKQYLQYVTGPVKSELADSLELAPKQWVALQRAITEGQAKVANGWVKAAEDLRNPNSRVMRDKNGDPVMLNAVTGEYKPVPEGLQLTMKMSQAERDQKYADIKGKDPDDRTDEENNFIKGYDAQKQAVAKDRNAGKTTKPGATSPEEKRLTKQVADLKRDYDEANTEYGKKYAHTPAETAALKAKKDAYDQQRTQLEAMHGTPSAKVPQNTQVPAGKAVIYDPQNNPHTVDANLVDQYLASPDYKGWHK